MVRESLSAQRAQIKENVRRRAHGLSVYVLGKTGRDFPSNYTLSRVTFSQETATVGFNVDLTYRKREDEEKAKL
jgi:hypothetical protein